MAVSVAHLQVMNVRRRERERPHSRTFTEERVSHTISYHNNTIDKKRSRKRGNLCGQVGVGGGW